MKKHLFILTVLIFCLFPQIKQISDSGFFPMHDNTQIARVVAMGNALMNGQFPVRWVSDLGYGYGYPIFNFYGPLPYYAGGTAYALGFDALTSTKIMFVLGILIGLFTSYYMGYRMFGISGGFVSALVFSYLPYHAVQLFVRGSIGEFWAAAWLPLITAGIFQMYKKRGGVLLAAFGIAGTVLSHTLLGFAAVLFIVVFLLSILMHTLLYKKKKEMFFRFCLSVIAGLGLSAFFWLPAVFEMSFTHVKSQVSATSDFRDHFICMEQLWSSDWGFGGSTAGCSDGMSFALGKAFIFLALSGCITLFLKRNSHHQKAVLAMSGLVVFISLFFTLSVSQFFWEIIVPFKYLQYPWRFLSFTMLGMSLFSGAVVLLFQNNRAKIVMLSIITIVILWQGQERFYPQYRYAVDVNRVKSASYLRFEASRISDEYLPESIKRPTSEQESVYELILPNDSYTVKPLIERETYKKYEFLSQNDAHVAVHVADFPGWKYIVNGKQQMPPIEHGLPIVRIPKGFSTMELFFTHTPIRSLGNVISLLFVVILLYSYGKKTFS